MKISQMKIQDGDAFIVKRELKHRFDMEFLLEIAHKIFTLSHIGNVNVLHDHIKCDCSPFVCRVCSKSKKNTVTSVHETERFHEVHILTY